MGNDDEFWRDHAATIQQGETGGVFRMPAASTVVPSDLVGSYAEPSADYRAGLVVSNAQPSADCRTDEVRQYSTPATLACMALIATAFGGVIWWLQVEAVTLAEFERLQVGMTPDQCRAIIGHHGTVTADARLSGIKMPNGQALFQDQLTIEWKNNSNSSCAAHFSGGLMNMKAQEGLK